MPKFNIGSVFVPELVTVALEPGVSVEVVPTVTVILASMPESL